MTTQYIYALVDPDLEQVFYVGRTTNPTKRLKAHIYYGSRMGGHYETCAELGIEMPDDRNTWVGDILKRGKQPIMTILDTCEPESVIAANEVEHMWIRRHLNNGAPLTNRHVADSD